MKRYFRISALALLLLIITVGCLKREQGDMQLEKSHLSQSENADDSTITVDSQLHPLIHLGFDEEHGMTLTDSQGYLDQGNIQYVFNAAKYQNNREPLHTSTAIKGNALIFDGYSTFIEYEDAKLMSESLSCSVWVAPRAFEWGDKGLPSTIISQYDSSTASGFQFGVYRFGSYGVELYTKEGKIKLESEKINDFVPKFAWTQIAFTYDASMGTLRLYKNGIMTMSETIGDSFASVSTTKENTQEHVSIPFKPADKALLIGKNNESTAIATFSANMFDGALDELKVYDQAVSQEAMLLDYQNDLAPHAGAIPIFDYKAIALNVNNIKEDIHRPIFHIGAPEHWMNEPHAAFYYKGFYHIFYQHNPFGPFWHQIHWGHMVSSDMIHWEYLPDALSPTYASVAPDGIWSGSSVLDREGNPVIFYTAGNDSMQPNQNIAVARPKDLSDPKLTEWVMEPTLTVVQQHGQGEFGSFRDPYVWYDKESDYYYMLVGSGLIGAQKGEKGGTALVYRSYDLKDWTYFGPFTVSDYDAYPYLGQRWELPVFMTLSQPDGTRKDILLLSPHGDGADVEVYYFTGHFDRELVRFVKDSEEPKKIDLGNGVFTGPSGFYDPISKKNILFTIAQGERDSWAEYFAGWAHNGGMPMELTLDEDGNLRVAPVAAVASLRQKPVVNLEHVTVAEANEALSQIQGDAFDIELTFSRDGINEDKVADRFGMYLRTTPDHVEETLMYYDNSKQGLYVNRLHSSLDATKKDITGDLFTFEDTLSLRILVDRSLIEIYANQERSLTTRVYPTLSDAKGLELFEEDGTIQIEKLVIYPMNGIY